MFTSNGITVTEKTDNREVMTAIKNLTAAADTMTAITKSKFAVLVWTDGEFDNGYGITVKLANPIEVTAVKSKYLTPVIFDRSANMHELKPINATITIALVEVGGVDDKSLRKMLRNGLTAYKTAIDHAYREHDAKRAAAAAEKTAAAAAKRAEKTAAAAAAKVTAAAEKLAELTGQNVDEVIAKLTTATK